MRVAVTGATGFIGSHVAVALAKAGHQVVATGRDPSKTAPQPLSVKVRRNASTLSWLLLTLLVVCAVPVFAIWRSMGFESRRWAQSDGASGDDE